MSSPKDLSHLKLDFTGGEWDLEGIHIPADVVLAIVNAANREEAARLCNLYISSALEAHSESKVLKKWAKDDLTVRSKKNGATVNESILERHNRWQDEAEEIWVHCDLSVNETAKRIANDEDHHWTTIRKYIKK